MATAASVSGPSSTAHKGLHIALWVAQVLLALGFGMGGLMKSTTPMAELAAKMPWAGAVPELLVRLIGISEVAAAVGLILPAATKVRPSLTPLAAACLVVVMVLAAIFHVTRGEFEALPINIVLGGLAAFVAWGRHKKAPIAAR